MIEVCDHIKMDRPRPGLNFVTLFLYNFGSIIQLIGICVAFNKSKRSLAVVLIFIAGKSYAFSDHVFVATCSFRLWEIKLSFYIVCFVV